MSQKLNDTLENFRNECLSLESASKEKIATERDLAGIIKLFELLYETCWKCLKTLLEELGSPTRHPRTTFETAFKTGIIQDDKAWSRIKV